jgi:sulfate permease, SulP family
MTPGFLMDLAYFSVAIIFVAAVGMVKPAEVREVLRHNRFHMALMFYTAVMVVFTDFLVGVLSAIVLYGLLHRFFDGRRIIDPEVELREQ